MVVCTYVYLYYNRNSYVDRDFYYENLSNKTVSLQKLSHCQKKCSRQQKNVRTLSYELKYLHNK